MLENNCDFIAAIVFCIALTFLSDIRITYKHVIVNDPPPKDMPPPEPPKKPISF